MKLKHLDLFSGIGGFSLGLERTGGFETVAFCEIEPFCQKVLKKHWPDVPIYNDVRELEYDGAVDIITGGYPCQPFSTAGKRQGEEDDRHLWPVMFSLIKKHRPSWVIGENVVGHISMGLDRVLADLESEGYRSRTFIIPACAVNAPHRRDRVWIVANNDSSRLSWSCSGAEKQNIAMGSKDVADTKGGKPSKSRGTRTRGKGFGDRGFCEGHRKNSDHWNIESCVDRVANGLSRWVDRLRALGNAVVPQIPEIIGNAILEALSH